jgi:DNA-binding NarL/FixJ family response regulator
MPISIVVVVEVRLYREAVVRALSDQDDLRLLGEGDSARVALIEISRSQPDVVLLDLGIPHALDAVRQARAVAPDTRIVALGFGGTDAEVVAAAEAGLGGYIGVHQPLDDVITAIRGVVRGEAPCDGLIAAALLRRVAARAGEVESAPVLAELTSRERRILELLARGLSNKEIASELVIGLATVKTHVHAILRKLEVSRRGAAADVFRRAQVIGAGARAA